jgi:hypothetical protein
MSGGFVIVFGVIAIGGFAWHAVLTARDIRKLPSDQRSISVMPWSLLLGTLPQPALGVYRRMLYRGLLMLGVLLLLLIAMALTSSAFQHEAP